MEADDATEDTIAVTPLSQSDLTQSQNEQSEHGRDQNLEGLRHDMPNRGVGRGRGLRIPKACETCRKKKSKCDGRQPVCTPCENNSLKCAYAEAQRPRRPLKALKHVAGLEDRLRRMEGLLARSGLLSSEADSSISPEPGSLGVQPSGVPGVTSAPEQTFPLNVPPYQSLPPQSTDPSPGYTVPAATAPGLTPGPWANQPQFSRPSIIPSVPSPLPPNLPSTNPTGQIPTNSPWASKARDTMAELSEALAKTSFWSFDSYNDLFSRREYTPLPSKEEALEMLKFIFTTWFSEFPLFHGPKIFDLVDAHYEGKLSNASWLATFNVILALSYRIRPTGIVEGSGNDDKAWGYLKNALGLLPELLLRNADLLTIQAVTGMSIFLQGTANPYQAWVLLGTAIRMAHSFRLHRTDTDGSLSPEHIRERNNVFWCVYILDRELCLRSNLPPAQEDSEVNQPPPPEVDPDGIGDLYYSATSKINIFRTRALFARIQGNVYKRLYSPSATTATDSALLDTIGALDRELQEWRDSIPLELRPEHPILMPLGLSITHVVILQFSYYHCLGAIHRMSVRHGYWADHIGRVTKAGVNLIPDNPRVLESAALCVEAARASVQLKDFVPKEMFTCAWLITYYPVSSLVTLFINVLQNPQDPRARSDVRLIHAVVSFVAELSASEASAERTNTQRIHSIISEFERVATTVVNRAEAGLLSGNSPGIGGWVNPTPPTAAPSQRGFPDASASAAPLSVPLPSQHQPPQHTLSDLYNPSPTYHFSADPTVPSTHLSGAHSTSDHSSSSNDPGMDPDPAGIDTGMPFSTESFENPFVPPELMMMPMTFEWDWAGVDMENIGNGGMGGLGGLGMSGMGQGFRSGGGGEGG